MKPGKELEKKRWKIQKPADKLTFHRVVTGGSYWQRSR